MHISTVTVIGANGTMGCNISGIFAAFGNAKVYLISRDIEKSKQAVQRAVKSVRADSIAKNLIPMDYSMLAACVQESDLIFESVAENLDLKRAITKQIAECVRQDAIIASGTSGLSVTTLAELFPEQIRSRYLGIHMYNPPYNLTLCEVIPTVYSDRALCDNVKQYLADTLRRTVVEVKDSPAFLGNRVGFQFINKVLQYAQKYRHSGGIDYIDAIMGPYTGRSMAPLVTSDFVGLDVHKAIVDNIHQNTVDYARETFVFPEFAQRLINEGKLGRKTRGGLYRLEVSNSGAKQMQVYDIQSDSYRDRMDYHFPFAEQMKQAMRIGDYERAFATLIENRSVEAEICLELMLEYIVYALFAAQQISYDIHSADDVMAVGFNWCPPMAMAEALGCVSNLTALIKERVDGAVLNAVDVDSLLKRIVPSRYDYRPYFKSM